ncbi:tRNA-uridine aminocarboxypropyltransferase 2 isoform X3 [Perognathus longimembris pacificus]|uniref:tRNA-uridine aminocarboxypropyltransferase 2 isoform X3 n=1 Tax=Perognathus longimembris pacificus TaxID=214514 RepID=UPI0020185AB0|nr:tRNA-uridine aminocarboxypropyltransferase 2 isoform X3 [Perognathus longimembris pacificus]
MEPQKEPRALRDSSARPPGASRLPAWDGEERPEPGVQPAAPQDAEAAGASAAGLWELPAEPAERRPECGGCGRPLKVCLCPFLPAHPLSISTHLYIIQHPAEESKVLRTVPLLVACLPQDKCTVKVGRRFSGERDVELSTVCRKSGTLILYPGAEATDLEEFLLSSPVYPSTIIIIDGTWSQAKDIFYKNSLFRLPKQVQLKTNISSQYVIRMQPTNRCLSTLECAAVALSILEKNIHIQEVCDARFLAVKRNIDLILTYTLSPSVASFMPPIFQGSPCLQRI